MRVLERETLHLFFGTMALLCFMGFAQASSIHCKTAFGERSFTVENSSVAFHKQKAGRTISSIMDARTKVTHQGFNKVLYIDGNKHLIHIENENNFSDAHDYMTITNQRGHKMTYPLTCSK